MAAATAAALASSASASASLCRSRIRPDQRTQQPSFRLSSQTSRCSQQLVLRSARPQCSLHSASRAAERQRQQAGGSISVTVVTAAAAEAAAASTESEAKAEAVYFDGGPHYGDFAVNFVLGLTGVWLPITLTSLFRTLYLRYRFTDRRFTVLSGLSDSDRRDYPYSAVAEVKSVPRFLGDWGDIAITLKDKTTIELKSVPEFRKVANYCEDMAAKAAASKAPTRSSGSSKGSSQGF